MSEHVPYEDLLQIPVADYPNHKVQFKWVVSKGNGGNYGLTYPIMEKRNVDLHRFS